jgi:hypothetical protein
MERLKCDKHPKYLGKRKPKNECETCLSMYLNLRRDRIKLPRPQPPHRDKSKFSRKRKHSEERD